MKTTRRELMKMGAALVAAAAHTRGEDLGLLQGAFVN